MGGLEPTWLRATVSLFFWRVAPVRAPGGGWSESHGRRACQLSGALGQNSRGARRVRDEVWTRELAATDERGAQDAVIEADRLRHFQRVSKRARRSILGQHLSVRDMYKTKYTKGNT